MTNSSTQVPSCIEFQTINLVDLFFFTLFQTYLTSLSIQLKCLIRYPKSLFSANDTQVFKINRALVLTNLKLKS